MIGPKCLRSTLFVVLFAFAYGFPGDFPDELGAITDSISVSLTDVKLEKVLRILSEKSGMEFISDPAVKDRNITLDLKDVGPLEALSILTELYDLGYQQLGESGKFVVAESSQIRVPTQLRSYTCEFAQATDLAAIVAKVATPVIGSVFSDERTNTIIYQDTRTKIGEIERLIRELDRPTRQVYIKAAIAEVSVTQDDERGVHWFTEKDPVQKDPDRGRVVAGTDFGALDDLPFRLTFPGIGGGLGVGILDYGIDVAIAALSKTRNLNVLSSPYLITLDNQEAVIEVGDQIPYPKLNQFGVTSYEFKDATIRLKIRPHINNDSTITIHLEPQANFQQGFTPDNIPIIAKRSAKTQVVVQHGKTVVLGGLMRESDIITNTQVPFLGSIPLIGELFKSTKVTKQKTELVVMITPKIVDLYAPEMGLNSNGGVPDEFQGRIK